jgi:glucokinase
MSARVIGVDLGGTQIRSVLATLEGDVHARDSRLTLADEGPNAVLDRIIASVSSVIDIASTDGRERVAAIGIGAPGPTDPHRGVILMGPNLPGWNHVNLRDLLYKPFGVPVYVGNDANLAGLAEFRFGAGKGVDHMVYITQSTGIGGGIIVNRKMLVGAQGLAAEVGHMTIDLSQDDPANGVVGTLEGLAAGPDIAARAQRRLHAGATSIVTELAGGSIEAVGSRHLCEAAQARDAFALELFRETGVYLGVGITNLLHIFNPQRIVIGGSVWLNCQSFMVDAVWSTIKARAQSPEYWQWLEIVPAALGDDVGLLGAVALAVGELNKSA